jgi:hypothetical protein
LVVECDRGGERDEARGEADAEVLQGACAVSFEGADQAVRRLPTRLRASKTQPKRKLSVSSGYVPLLERQESLR